MSTESRTGTEKSWSLLDLKSLRVSYLVAIGSGLLLAVIIVISSFLISAIARDSLIRVNEFGTRGIAEHLSHMFIPQFTASYPEEEFGHSWKESGWQEGMDELVRGNLHGLDVSKIKIFDRHGRIIYSTDPAVTGSLVPHNLNYQAALAGQTSSRLKQAQGLWDFSWEEGPRKDMIETYVPVRSAGSEDPDQVIGVFEIYRDADFLVETLSTLRTTFLWTSLVALGLLFAVFSVIAIIGLKKKLQWEKIDTIDEVAVGIKHRLNNSLTGILNVLGLLLQDHAEGPPLDDETREALEKCEHEARRMQKVVEKLSHMETPVVAQYVPGVNMIDFDEST